MESATLDELLDVDIDSLGRADLLDYVEAAERGKASFESRSQRALARLLELDASGKEYVAEEVAAVLRLAPATALGRLHQAADLVTRLPRLMELLALGDTTGCTSRPPPKPPATCRLSWSRRSRTGCWTAPDR